MRLRILRGAFVFAILAVGCALVGGRSVQAGSVQEQQPAAKEPSRSERDREERRQAEQRRAGEAAKTKHQEELEAKRKREEAAKQQHVPEIDGASIPTALVLLGAGVVMLRARLRSKQAATGK